MGTKILSFNACSLQGKDRYYEVIKCLDHLNVDIGLIQETRWKPGHFTQVVQNYNLFRNDEGVGTAVLIRKNWKIEWLTVPDLKTMNATIIKVKGGRCRDLIVGSLYIKCNSDRLEVCADLESILSAIGNNPCVLGGDLNTGTPGNKLGVKKFTESNSDLINLCSPNKPTFRRGNSMLDYFLFSTDITASSRAETYNIQLGDHLAIHTEFSLNFFALENKGKVGMKWRKTNWVNFHDEAIKYFMPAINVDKSVSNTDIDKAVESVTSCIKKAMEDLIPKGLIGRGKPLELSDQTEHLFRDRRRLKRKLEKMKDSWDIDRVRIEAVKRSIIQATNLINKTIQKTENDGLIKKIHKINEANGGESFRGIKKLISKRGKPRHIKLKNKSGTTITGEENQGNEFAEFYADLYEQKQFQSSQETKVINSLEEIDNIPMNTTFGTENKSSNPQCDMELYTHFTEVKEVVKGLKNKTSTGSDQIPNIVLKHLPAKFILELVAIFNNCINNGYYPTAWKKAIIIPFPKKNGIAEAKDFRPISLTSNLGKIFEAILLNRIKGEMDPDYIPEYQFGFKNDHGTIDALKVINSRLESNRERRLHTVMCSLDIKKAFDSVWQDGLKHKITKIGISPALIRTIASFLDDRKATIRIGSTLSKEIGIFRGVPQGSRLGPVLYNIYTADLKEHINMGREGGLLQYADDTLITYASTNIVFALDKVEKKVAEINNYLNDWGIQLNPDKTECIIARHRNKSHKGYNKWRNRTYDGNINICKEKVKVNRTIKYLGITFDTKGTFKQHTINMALKARQLVGAAGILLRRKEVLHKVKKRVYNTIIRPGFTYACQIWMNNKNLKTMEIAERKAYRIITNMFRQADSAKYLSNKMLYEGMNNTNLRELVDKTKEKFKLRISNHVNKLVRVA